MKGQEKEGILAYKVFTRIGKKKYDELLSLLEQSRCRTMSELLRKILEDKKIMVETHDNSLDKVMEQLSGIRKELQAIGININQVTHYFHIQDTAEGRLFQSMEVAKLYQQADQKVSALFEVIANLSEQWLPK